MVCHAGVPGRDPLLHAEGHGSLLHGNEALYKHCPMHVYWSTGIEPLDIAGNPYVHQKAAQGALLVSIERGALCSCMIHGYTQACMCTSCCLRPQPCVSRSARNSFCLMHTCAFSESLHFGSFVAPSLPKQLSSQRSSVPKCARVPISWFRVLPSPLHKHRRNHGK